MTGIFGGTCGVTPLHTKETRSIDLLGYDVCENLLFVRVGGWIKEKIFVSTKSHEWRD